MPPMAFICGSMGSLGLCMNEMNSGERGRAPLIHPRGGGEQVRKVSRIDCRQETK